MTPTLPGAAAPVPPAAGVPSAPGVPAVAVPVPAASPDQDSDGDGLVDRIDRCPGEPETQNFYLDSDGCPDTLPASLQRFVGQRVEGVSFLPNQAVLAPTSNAVLDQLAAALQESPTVRMEIGGHTDNVGDPQVNLTLSQQRADAVKKYLEGKGIRADRLTGVGYGATKPLGDNQTPQGRAQNRRVEFKLMPETERAAPPRTAPLAPQPAAPTMPAAPLSAPAAPPTPPAQRP
jgi:outer membrane protein OmpA-like peptidoglycan-associated protein